MKRLSNITSNDENEVDITPMLDVVFIMLIFFIVSATFVKESGIALNVPQQSTDKTTEPESIVVSVTEFGEVLIQERIVNSAMVEATIIRLRAEKPDANIVVKVEDGSKTGLLVQVVDGIRAAHYTMPSISLVKG